LRALLATVVLGKRYQCSYAHESDCFSAYGNV
jgi:hypothetical protein